MTGPGPFSLDRALGLTLPEPFIYLAALAAMSIGVLIALKPISVLQRHEQN
jgi:hypothetical protein